MCLRSSGGKFCIGPGFQQGRWLSLLSQHLTELSIPDANSAEVEGPELGN